MAETTYLAFLRAINVGGKGVVKMERLRELFAELGFGRVRTYIQSGNVFFTAEETDEAGRAALTERIEQHLEASLGFKVPAMLRTLQEVEELVAADPFAGIEVTADMRLMVLFLTEPLPDSLELPLRSPKGDWEIISATPGAAFVVTWLVNGRPSPGPVKVIPKPTTGRFFHTTEKILAAAKK